MNIINFSQKLDEIVSKNDLINISSLFKNDFAISKTNELAKAIEVIKEEGRVLKIGVVGRVKAGKSSLLNALIFDGKNILPKAATPMTAALTILEYSEETKAEVDFFTQKDIDDIKKDYDNYNRQLEQLTESRYKELEKLYLIKKKKELEKKQTLTDKAKDFLQKDISEIFNKEDENKIKEKAEKQATRELKSNDSLVSSYDQYNRIKACGIEVSELDKFKEITADSAEELNEKLLDFVGADGRYMPFTKSVTLKLNEESLKDIQIIDTPGINDPVTSREERTKELLKYCDVIFIVSPAGQFLNSADMDLFDRITSKEGIKEIYIIASQIDNQLYGSEKAKGDGIPSKVLNVISDTLTTQMRSIFENDEYLKDNETFQSLLKNRVIHSSGISYGLMKKFDDKESWDSNENHVWGLLTSEYKDFFETKEASLANLKLLANIETIHSILDEVKSKKDEILKEKKESFISNKLKNLVKYQNALTSDMKEKIERVKNSDINEIKQQKEYMEKIQNRVSVTINDEYFDIIERLEIDIKSILYDKLNSYFKRSKRDITDSEGSETERYEVSSSSWYNPFSWGGTKTKTRTYTTVKAGHIKNSLENLTDEIENVIDIDSKEYLLNWRKKLTKTIISKLRAEAGDDNLDISLINQTIRKVLNSVVYPNITYDGELPIELKRSGSLIGSDAEIFISDAENYVSNLKGRVKKDIKSYLSTLINSLKEVDIAKSIFKNYHKEIENLTNEIENRELTLDRYSIIIQELENIDAQ